MQEVFRVDMVNKSHVYVHFIPGKEAQIEGKPWIIHSAAGDVQLDPVNEYYMPDFFHRRA